MRRNAIVTVAVDYGLDRLESFLASWHENVASGELVVFAKGCDEAFYAAAARLGVTVYDYRPRRPYAVMGARHFVYRDFVRANRRNFDAVLLADARDVVFQSDPFDVPRAAPVMFAAEDRLIGECNMNRLWLAHIYGGRALETLDSERISCAGTTIGSTDGIERYLDLMCNEADIHSEHILHNGDQGFHNYILHRLKPPFVSLDEEDRIVSTLGFTEPERIRFVDGRVSVDGHEAPVLHQWDRRDTLIHQVQHRYRLTAAA